ncbi:cytochrome P450 [Bombardia bombarda]|uniref:Cytochrome P450 n=1 Tax=Bombardia bombarda TaxID=252184 RepID=A0AA39WCE3_9PEZI|nr:cytochrome P450 [Bombardia bombarda]
MAILLQHFAAVLVILLLAGRIIHQLFFHPLAKFPGPFYTRVSYLAVCKWTLQGRWSHTIKELHQRYGPVVRVGPNTLSFSTVHAARAIYGNKPLFLKNDMYDAFGSGLKGGPSGLFPEKDPEVHAELKRVFAPCFFEDELRRQEPLVQKYVDLLVDRIEEHEVDKGGVDINFWARAYVADVISDLSFGEPFGSLADGAQHFWVKPLREKFIISAVFECCRRYPLLISVYWYLYSKFRRDEALKLHQYASARIKRHFELPPRADFISVVSNPRDSLKRLDLQVLRANLYGFLMGATETTSFAVTAALHFLAKHADAQKRLSDELHGSLAGYESITMEALENLSYLRAVIDETLRMLPPSPVGGMRVSPGTLVEGSYIPDKTEVFSSYIAISRSDSYFAKPDEFRPERWTDTHNSDIKGASLAFSLGPRNCIGRPLALLKVRLAIAKIIYRFEVATTSNTVLNLEEGSRHFGGPWVSPPVMLKFRSRLAKAEVTKQE